MNDQSESALKSNKLNQPMTALESGVDCEVLNAQMHLVLPGTWTLEKLHLELKYLGKNGAAANLHVQQNLWAE